MIDRQCNILVQLVNWCALEGSTHRFNMNADGLHPRAYPDRWLNGGVARLSRGNESTKCASCVAVISACHVCLATHCAYWQKDRFGDRMTFSKYRSGLCFHFRKKIFLLMRHEMAMFAFYSRLYGLYTSGLECLEFNWIETLGYTIHHSYIFM